MQAEQTEQDTQAALYKAARNNDIKQMIDIIQRGVAKYELNNLLRYLVQSDDASIAMIELVVKSGASIHTEDYHINTLLHLVVDPTVARWLITAGAPHNRRNKSGFNAFEAACVAGRDDVVRVAHELGISSPVLNHELLAGFLNGTVPTVGDAIRNAPRMTQSAAMSKTGRLENLAIYLERNGVSRDVLYADGTFHYRNQLSGNILDFVTQWHWLEARDPCV